MGKYKSEFGNPSRKIEGDIFGFDSGNKDFEDKSLRVLWVSFHK